MVNKIKYLEEKNKRNQQTLIGEEKEKIEVSQVS